MTILINGYFKAMRDDDGLHPPVIYLKHPLVKLSSYFHLVFYELPMTLWPEVAFVVEIEVWQIFYLLEALSMKLHSRLGLVLSIFHFGASVREI